MHDFVWIFLRKKLQHMVCTLKLGLVGSLSAVYSFGWSFLAVNFDPGFRLIQKLDHFENKLKNPGFLCRNWGIIRFFDTIIYLKWNNFRNLAHCEMKRIGIFFGVGKWWFKDFLTTTKSIRPSEVIQSSTINWIATNTFCWLKNIIA